MAYDLFLTLSVPDFSKDNKNKRNRSEIMQAKRNHLEPLIKTLTEDLLPNHKPRLVSIGLNRVVYSFETKEEGALVLDMCKSVPFITEAFLGNSEEIKIRC